LAHVAVNTPKGFQANALESQIITKRKIEKNPKFGEFG